MNTFGERLKLALKSAGYTQKKITEDLNLSKNAITNYVNGRIPDAKILYNLSKKLGVTMEWLIDGEEPKKEQLSGQEKVIQHILGDLTDKEIKFIEMLRQIDDHEKAKIEGMLELKIAEAQATKKEMSYPYPNGDEEAATKEKLA
ncbi:helix-turn-helix domain-containing protein [Clostridium lundense]|uniref:helix-turn-helix domain-containing protein n=1 Tax=Clostridium lundense TaxID=319475 RepID=UPI00048966BB|nr:helix-turn-helix transcriptional regulator [Clostridium lundense]